MKARGYILYPALLLAALTAACQQATAPHPTELCPVLTTTQVAGATTVRTWAYFRQPNVGPSAAYTVTYNSAVIPPCFAF